MKPGPPVEREEERRHKQVRERYGKIAAADGCGCAAGSPSGCCGDGIGSSGIGDPRVATEVGYSGAELATLPKGSNLGLGCGNPTALASLKKGEIVLDMGSGAGIDCFLAGAKVGPDGHVIGVDMTPEMLEKARTNAHVGGYRNVEFRLGEIEHLPVADQSVNVVVSNCVINLAPDKSQVYREAFRVLRPGGRFVVSDVVATRPITPQERADPALWTSCSSGALEASQVRRLLRAAGFTGIRIEVKEPDRPPEPLRGQRSLGVVSADILAIRPRE